jgi:hypothetical protein
LKPTTHEPCLYHGTYKGHDVLLCRQEVDDMLNAGADRVVLRSFAEDIGKHLHAC